MQVNLNTSRYEKGVMKAMLNVKGELTRESMIRAHNEQLTAILETIDDESVRDAVKVSIKII